MLGGLTGGLQRIFSFLRALHVKKSGFTLIEILLVGFLLSVVMAALLLSLTTVQLSNSVSPARADLQAEVRLMMDWIVKDVRQTNPIQINNNSPSGNHIKFQQVTGIDNTTGQYTLSPNYIEYNYDNVTGILSRNDIINGVAQETWAFNNITQSPFYTQVGPNVLLQPGDILTSKKLIIIIAAQKQLRQSSILNFSLSEEVKLRNE